MFNYSPLALIAEFKPFFHITKVVILTTITKFFVVILITYICTMKKHVFPVRLNDFDKELLDRLSEKKQTSKALIVAEAIRLLAKKEKIKP